MGKKGLDQQAMWNRAIIGFFLAVYSGSTKTANLLLKTYGMIRIVLGKIGP